MSPNSLKNMPLANDRDELLNKIRELEERCRKAEDTLQSEAMQNRLLADSLPFGIFCTDAEGDAYAANRKFLKMLGWSADQDIHRLNVLNYPPMVESGVAEVFRRCMETKSRTVSDHACMAGAEECAHQRFHISPVIDNDGVFAGIIVFVEDVTELKMAEEAIRDREKKYKLLFDSAPVAMVERDASKLKQHLEKLQLNGVSDLRAYFDRHPEERIECLKLIRTVDYNSAFLDLMEAQTWDEIESGFSLINSPDYLLKMASDVIMMVASGCKIDEREDTFMTIRGARKNVLAKSLPLTGHEDTLSRIVIAMLDITKRKAAEQALRESERNFREQAMRDNLTGLYNQRYLYQSLAGLIENAGTSGSVVSLIFMDIDHFKLVVDTYGHLNGSRAIKEVGRTIQEAIKRPAYAVAYAGDEFVVVMPGKTPDEAVYQAKEIRKKMRDRVFLQDFGLEVNIRFSFGIAGFPHNAENMTDLLAAADKALFAAKGDGKDMINTAD